MNKKILVVEDDSSISKILSSNLKKRGHSVTTAGNGLEGLKCLEKDLPDLILLDLLMPGMDGHSFFEELKSNDSYKDIPVLVLTNLSEDNNADSGRLKGAKSYILKSDVSMVELMEEIDEIL